MPKAFITAPYTGKSIIEKGKLYGKIKDKRFIKFLCVIEAIVKDCNFYTFLPHRDIHQWGSSCIEPNKVYQKVLEEIKNCDILIAYPEKSSGANVEIGIAVTLRKKIVILLKENDELSLSYLGLNTLTDTKIVRFKDMSDLKSKLSMILTKGYVPKAYIAAPFTGKSVKEKELIYGQIKEISYKNFLETIDATVRGLGFETYLPHRDLHNWGTTYIEPSFVTKRSLEELSSSDLLVVYPERSAGANIELGWASVFNKNIIILVHEKDEISLMQAGLNGLTNTKVIKFTDISDLRYKLREGLADVKNRVISNHLKL